MSEKRRILLIENQQFQHLKIVAGLKPHFDVYPERGDYRFFIDCVRVWVNEEYPDHLRKIAIKFIMDVIDPMSNSELIVMDHILGGGYSCLDGIDLAAEINRSRQEMNATLPVLFISKTEFTEQKRLDKFEKYQADYPGSSDWVHKGYFGDEILEDAFLEKNVVPRIEKLLNEGVEARILKLLAGKDIEPSSYSNEFYASIRSDSKILREGISQGQIIPTEELYRKLENAKSHSDLAQVLREIVNG